MSKKLIQLNYPNAVISKVLFKDYDYMVQHNTETYYVKKIGASHRTILSINSKYVWEIRRGRPDGLNFKTSGKTMIDMKEFSKRKNKIVVLDSKPYKILKYLNESEVEDITNETEVHDIKICHSFYEFKI